MHEIAYYYSVRSSFAYLGAGRLNRIARDHAARIVHRPILLALTMPAAGGRPFAERPAIALNYAMHDAQRWARHLGLQLHREPVHHVGAFELPSGLVIAAQRRVQRGEAGDVDRLSETILAALWADDRDTADAGVLGELAGACGFSDVDALIGEAGGGPAQAELARNCREAVMRGVIGSPTYFVGEENFYGQDRLEFVARALAAMAGPSHRDLR